MLGYYPHLDLKLKESWKIISNREDKYDEYKKPSLANFQGLLKEE